MFGAVWFVGARRVRLQKGSVDGEFGSAQGVHRLYYACRRVVVLRFRHAPGGLQAHGKSEQVARRHLVVPSSPASRRHEQHVAAERGPQDAEGQLRLVFGQLRERNAVEAVTEGEFLRNSSRVTGPVGSLTPRVITRRWPP